MKFGLDAEKFLTQWALENSEELVEMIDDVLSDEKLSYEQKLRAIYTKNLNFTFSALSAAINENNKVIAKQLKRAGVDLPYFKT